MGRLSAWSLLFLAVLLPASACNLIADSEPHLRDGHADAAEIPAETEGEALQDPADTAADDPRDLPDPEEEDGVDPCTLYDRWYRDGDNDNYGNEDDFVCRLGQPDGFVEDAGDCCDTNGEVNPNQSAFFDVPYLCAEEERWDYNCDGLMEGEVPSYFDYDACSLAEEADECDLLRFWYRTSPQPCGTTGSLHICEWNISDGFCTLAETDNDARQRCR